MLNFREEQIAEVADIGVREIGGITPLEKASFPLV